MDVGEILRRLRERHDVAAGGARSEALLHIGDRAEDLEHLLGQLAARVAGTELVEHLAVHSRVLAHLEFGEVEAVGLDLPYEALECTVGLASGTRGDEGVLHAAQVGQQVLGIAVGEVGVARAGRGDLAGEQQQDAAVRFVGGALGDLRGGVLVGRAQAVPQCDEGVTGWGGLGIQGQSATDALRRPLEAQQHVLAGDRGGLARDGRRDERVAVAVAADPGADPHEGLHDGGAGPGVLALEDVVDAAVDPGHGRVEGLVEDRHHRAHLVDRRRLLASQWSGAPERVDLLEHAALGAAALAVVAGGVVVLGEQLGEATDAGGDRPPRASVGWAVEDGVEAQGLQALERRLASDLAGQTVERRGDRVGRAGARGGVTAFAQDADALVLLDEVDEVEVRREGAGHLVGALDREPVGDRRGPLERLRCLVGVGLDRRRAQPLDVVVQSGGAALLKDAAEERSEQAARRRASARAVPGRLRSGPRGRWPRSGSVHAHAQIIRVLLRADHV